MKGVGAKALAGFALLFLCGSIDAHADSIKESDCGKVRLDEAGGSMEHVPVTDQGDLGICYAHAASELVDAYRFSHEPPKGDQEHDFLTNPLAAALLYAELEKSASIEGGNACDTVDALKKYGLCRRTPEADLTEPKSTPVCTPSPLGVAGEFNRLQKLLGSVLRKGLSGSYSPDLIPGRLSFAQGNSRNVHPLSEG